MNAELRDVLELLEKATPGEWRIDECFTDHGARYIEITNERYHQVSDEFGPDPDNAAAIVAAVNFLRKHGEALSRPVVPDGDGDMRADAERYRYLRRPDAWREHDVKRPGSVSAIFVGTDAGYAEAYDGEALDAAIDAARSAAQEK